MTFLVVYVASLALALLFGWIAHKMLSAAAYALLLGPFGLFLFLAYSLEAGHRAALRVAELEAAED